MASSSVHSFLFILHPFTGLDINTHFETLDELEEVLAQRCCYLQDNMMTEIKNLTDYHWFTYV
ncbi:MAG: hypothetical protein AAGA60_29380 [Cyanobacteria bacterium P01_E01_bin.42]